MTVQQSLLDGVAKLLNSESFNVPSHLALSSDSALSVGTSETALDGEFGSRLSFTGTRADSTVTYNTLRSGAAVLDTTNGDSLYGLAAFNASSAGDFTVGIVLPGNLHTTAFDIDFDVSLSVTR